MLRGGRTLKDDELQMYFRLGLFRRGLGGPRELRRQTSWGEDDWFADASAVLQRVTDAFAAIGRRGPSPTHIMRQKDLEDARWIGGEIDRRRAEAGNPICAECFEPIELRSGRRHELGSRRRGVGRPPACGGGVSVRKAAVVPDLCLFRVHRNIS